MKNVYQPHYRSSNCFQWGLYQHAIVLPISAFGKLVDFPNTQAISMFYEFIFSFLFIIYEYYIRTTVVSNIPLHKRIISTTG